MKAGKPHLLKAANRARVLTLLRSGGTFTVADLAKSAQLSRMTVGKIIEHFHAKGIVSAAGKGDSTIEGGKKPETYRLNADFAGAIGIHIHPDHIVALQSNLSNEPCAVKTVVLAADEKPPGLIRRITRLCEEFSAKIPARGDGIAGIGIAVPGICNREAGTFIYSPWFPHWESGIPLASMLRDALRTDIPITVDNEFRFQVLAERHYRRVPESSTLIVIGGGRGLGSGIHHGGKILRGPHHLAGEIGHMVINPGGDPCSCGGRGCFEAMVHERRIRRLLKEGYAANRGSSLYRHKKAEKVSVTDVFAAAREGDRLAQAILDDVIHWFCIAISNIIVSFDPDTVVIHGLYAGAGEYFLERIRQNASLVALPKVQKTVSIDFSSLGDDSGMMGATLSVIDEYFRKRWS